MRNHFPHVLQVPIMTALNFGERLRIVIVMKKIDLTPPQVRQKIFRRVKKRTIRATSSV